MANAEPKPYTGPGFRVEGPRRICQECGVSKMAHFENRDPTESAVIFATRAWWAKHRNDHFRLASWNASAGPAPKKGRRK